MKSWSVMVPFAGTIEMMVDADSEEEAIEKAVETAPGIRLDDDACEAQIGKYLVAKTLVEGWVSRLPLNAAKATIERIYDE